MPGPEVPSLLRCCALLALGLSAGIQPRALAGQSAPSPAAPPPAAPVVELAPVVVKGGRIRLDTLAEQVRKAMKPQAPRAASADLNQAGEKMQAMAARMSEPDAYRRSVGDRRFDTLPPPGDETDGCGADLSQGCEKKP